MNGNYLGLTGEFDQFVASRIRSLGSILPGKVSLRPNRQALKGKFLQKKEKTQAGLYQDATYCYMKYSNNLQNQPGIVL